MMSIVTLISSLVTRVSFRSLITGRKDRIGYWDLRRAKLKALTCFACLPLMATSPIQAATPTTADQMMYFRSAIQDASECSVTVKNGNAVFEKDINSPAATCPDAYAWVSFAEAIRQEFWNWSQDVTVWPATPQTLCNKPGQSGCCDPSVLNQPKPIQGAPNADCPYSPSDWTDPPQLKVEPKNLHSPLFVDVLDPGRQLRDEEVELVYRNESMMRYIYERNLYNKEGLGARFRAVTSSVSNNAPYQNAALQVRFPASSIMVKADFVHQEDMLKAGLISKTGADGEKLDPPQNAKYPYVTVFFEGASTKDTGLYYLVAMTNSSKVLPGWHWYAIEHVANEGRCDFTGCNDSFGYTVTGTTVGGDTFGTNYIPPFPLSDPDSSAPSTPTGYGKVYAPSITGETVTKSLADLMSGLGVGTASKDKDPKTLDPEGPAWRNYRLKGTMTNFVANDGVETILGASVTEGGFVNSASCMACHSNATTDENGNPGVGGIGSQSRLNLFGFQQSQFGAPDQDWFYNPGTPTRTALQTDFVWGIP